MKTRPLRSALAVAAGCAWLAAALAAAGAPIPGDDGAQDRAHALTAAASPAGAAADAPIAAIAVRLAPIPEPATAVLLALGLAGLVRIGRRRSPRR